MTVAAYTDPIEVKCHSKNAQSPANVYHEDQLRSA